MVPVTHPNDLRAGETITWRFQLDGKPLPNLPFSLVPGGVRYRGMLGELRLTTDAKGEVKFTVPEANMYWLSAKFPPRRQRGRQRRARSATATRPRSTSCRSKGARARCVPFSFP